MRYTLPALPQFMPESNPNARLEAFSDGVFAIAITLLVLDFTVPPAAEIRSTRDLWAKLGHMLPTFISFLLSFIVILITWVNHHSAMKLSDKCVPAYLYANGLLLLTIAILPFPTALLGEYLLTDYASPGVVIYNAAIVIQAFAWVLVAETALRHHLARNAASAASIRANLRRGYGAIALYTGLAVLAIWLPRTVAAITAVSWIYWLITGITMRDEDDLPA